ncbi:MAG: hypothetical protein IPP74_03785 [Alphaproteobacteria bacterium]|nr:hypothetical protein [Alphaproteobacteria bacterium]
MKSHLTIIDAALGYVFDHETDPAAVEDACDPRIPLPATHPYKMIRAVLDQPRLLGPLTNMGAISNSQARQAILSVIHGYVPLLNQSRLREYYDQHYPDQDRLVGDHNTTTVSPEILSWHEKWRYFKENDSSDAVIIDTLLASEPARQYGISKEFAQRIGAVKLCLGLSEQGISTFYRLGLDVETISDALETIGLYRLDALINHPELTLWHVKHLSIYQLRGMIVYGLSYQQVEKNFGDHTLHGLFQLVIKGSTVAEAFAKCEGLDRYETLAVTEFGLGRHQVTSNVKRANYQNITCEAFCRIMLDMHDSQPPVDHIFKTVCAAKLGATQALCLGLPLSELTPKISDGPKYEAFVFLANSHKQTPPAQLWNTIKDRPYEYHKAIVKGFTLEQIDSLKDDTLNDPYLRIRAATVEAETQSIEPNDHETLSKLCEEIKPLTVAALTSIFKMANRARIAKQANVALLM